MAHTYRLDLCLRDQQGTLATSMVNAVLDSVKWELNAPSSMTYRLPQTADNTVGGKVSVNNTDTKLYIDGAIANWGVNHKTDDSAHVSTIECPGFMMGFAYRFVLHASLLYTSMDQFAIFSDIVAQMQTSPHWDMKVGTRGWNQTISVGGLTIEAPVGSTGVIRSRSYDRLDHQNVMDMMNEFPGLKDSVGTLTGFDISEQYVDASGNAARVIGMHYPQRGLRHNEITLEYGKNIIDYSVKTDGSRQVVKAYVTGGSNGDVRFEGNAATNPQWYNVVTNVLETAPTIGPEVVQSSSSQKDTTVLTNLANSYLVPFPTQAMDLTTVEVDDDALLGNVQPGDQVRVIINNGRNHFDDFFRVQTVEWKPGPATVKLGFVSGI